MTATLIALACHALGDFVLQTDRMAEEKFDSLAVRAAHCSVYTASFIPVVILNSWSLGQCSAFALALFISHFAIDSQRWHDAVPIWYDQALHVIALAGAVLIAGGWSP